MRGNEWNRLVSEPTATELNAALAEVRVRAVPIARRRARQRGAGLMLAVIAVGVLGTAAGRVTAPGLQLEPHDESWAHGIGGWHASTVAGGPAVTDGASWRWHVTAVDEMEGTQLNAGEAWIEGPVGTFFDLTLSSFGSQFQGPVRLYRRSDSTFVRIEGRVTRNLGSVREARIQADWDAQSELIVRPGEAIVLKPFGSAGEVATTVRIEGPYAAAPAGTMRWIRPDTLRVRRRDRASEAAKVAAGVRHALSGSSALFISTVFIPPARLEFSVAGHRPSVPIDLQFAGEGSRPLTIPGIDGLVFTVHGLLYGERQRCFVLRTQPGRRFFASGCMAAEARSAEFRIAQGSQVIQVRTLPY